MVEDQQRAAADLQQQLNSTEEELTRCTDECNRMKDELIAALGRGLATVFPVLGAVSVLLVAAIVAIGILIRYTLRPRS